MTELQALVGLNLVPEIGGVRLRRLLEVFGSVQEIVRASPDHLMQVSGIGSVIAGNIAALEPQMVDAEFERARRAGVQLVHCFEEAYPANLRSIYDPPLVLYIKGTLSAQDSRSLALVGSRHASLYGLGCAEKFGFELAKAGFTIVSGMARGIDTASHRGALKAAGRTLAVIGSGLTQIYPPENKGLAEEIAGQGAVVSEFPLETGPRKQNFPRRNRLISGLSLGTVVVEAARNSGALITVDYALEQGRDVFAVPGNISSRTASGVNELIKQGAALVSCSEDIISQYDAVEPQCASVHGHAPAFPITPGAALPPVSLSCIEEQVYTIITQQPVSFDALCAESGFEVPALWNALFGLLHKQLIRQLPGKLFVRAAPPT